MRALQRALLPLPLLAALFACGDNSNSPPVVVSVTVSPGTPTLAALGLTQQFSAVIKDQYGNTLTGKAVTWLSQHPSVATIDQATGLATAVANGTVQITASVDGIVGTANLTVLQTATKLVFIAIPASATAGRTFSPVVKVEIEDANNARVADATSNVTLAIGANPGGSTLGGTATVAAVTGIATFDGVSLNNAGVGYTLTAAAGSLPGVTSGAFTVVASHGPLAQLAPGFFHTCAINTAGTVYCWGANTSNQLGDGGTISRPHPEPVSGVRTYIAIAAGANHTCAIATGGAMYCWGQNTFGQLGDGSTNDRATPTPVFGGLTFTAVTAGFYHTCAIATGGASYCWGYNSDGQVGDGSQTDRHTPTPVSDTVTAAKITAGGSHSCELTASGDAYCWGSNSTNELGGGSVLGETIPILIADTITFATVSAGEFHTCGSIAAGTAYCWGGNSNGGLGDGTTTQRPSPVVVTGISVDSMSAGGLHSCGLTTAHAVNCWGYNALGQIGDGTNTDRPNATPVSGSLTFASLRAGPTHTCALTSAGAAYCWGDNVVGQLGDGTTTTRFAPVVVEP